MKADPVKRAEEKAQHRQSPIAAVRVGRHWPKRMQKEHRTQPGARTVAPHHRVRVLRHHHFPRRRSRRGMVAARADRPDHPRRLAAVADVPVRIGTAVQSAADRCSRARHRSILRGSRRQSFRPAHQRRCGAQKTRGPPPIRLNQALDLWMQKNDCAGKPGSCPRPIIIVAAGGASRAGFFTASVIGDLLDKAAQQGGALDASKDSQPYFAISAVSGSAPAAAMSVAAFARAEGGNKAALRQPQPRTFGTAIKSTIGGTVSRR